ncbi:MAG: NAD(P)-dependent oxidoreductase [Erythrobacter sp.]|nr:NAD(P)-dependent oxidoreductase [Erythrobacter sp.]
MAEDAHPRLALIGFGEAGSTFARAAGWGGTACAYDIDPAREAAMADLGVRPAASPAQALAEAQVVLSLVTADAALAAARAYSPDLPAGALWCDMNSVAPHTKRMAAAVVEAMGARYVDVAVMSPVDKLMAAPLLLAGPHAAEAQAALVALGFTNVRVAGDTVGRASAIKLCRSIMVKGLEALTAEMVMAASQAGVLGEVLASLDASEKPQSWSQRADYNLDRMLLHGRRRAAEMHEAAAMITDLGISPMMTENTVNWQEGLGALGVEPMPEGLDAKLAAIKGTPHYQGEI